MGHWDSDQVFPRFGEGRQIFFPLAKLAKISKYVTNCKALHVNTPFRALVVRCSNEVVDSTQKRMYAGQVGLCNLKLEGVNGSL